MGKIKYEMSEGIGYPLQYSWASLVAQLVKNLLTMQETWVWALGWEDSPGEGISYSLQYSGLENSVDYIVHGSGRVRHNWETFTFTLAEYRRILTGVTDGTVGVLDKYISKSLSSVIPYYFLISVYEPMFINSLWNTAESACLWFSESTLTALWKSGKLFFFFLNLPAHDSWILMITNGDYTIHLFTDTYWNPDMLKAMALEAWGLLKGSMYTNKNSTKQKSVSASAELKLDLQEAWEVSGAFVRFHFFSYK